MATAGGDAFRGRSLRSACERQHCSLAARGRAQAGLLLLLLLLVCNVRCCTKQSKAAELPRASSHDRLAVVVDLGKVDLHSAA